MKFNATRFLEAMYKLRSNHSSYEENYSIEVDLREGNVSNDNIVDCIVVTMTSTKKSDGYGGGPKNMVRTIEIFAEHENKKSILTSTSIEEIGDD